MKTVFVLGAGPAGLFLARKIADQGHRVVIFNRDVKPGGLAEYGIFPTKDRMKEGLRKQFAKILGLPNVHYFGNVTVGNGGRISLEQLRSWHPAAIVVAVGAQGTKRLGLAGEESAGVYAAKDFVYHYNQLPPYANQDFPIGKRVVIVGMGNVMVDIAHWLLRVDPERRSEQVIVLARRGPFEAKFSSQDFASIQCRLDRPAFEAELQRVQKRLAPGQNIADVAETNFYKHERKPHKPSLYFRFLTTPAAIHPDADGRIQRLTIAGNHFVERNGNVSLKSTGRTSEIDCDTLIAAIGDVVDHGLGLPVNHNGYATNPDTSYEATPGIYVVGGRKASEGLVGTTRMEAERCAALVQRYLEAHPGTPALSPGEIALGLPGAVTGEDLPFLEASEAEEMMTRSLKRFKYSDNESMLAAIVSQRSMAAKAQHPTWPPA